MFTFLKKTLFLFLLLGPLVVHASSVSAQEVSKKVLIFSTEDQFVPAVTILNRAIRTTMEQRSPDHIQFFYEAQDSFRIPSERYETELVELLRRKYEGQNIDLIYVFAPPALRFLVKHQDELFRNIPIVYMVLDQARLNDLNLGPHVTGVSSKMEFKPTLDIALALQPETQRVVVVAGSYSIDSVFLKQAQEEFRDLEGKVEITYLTGLPLAELKTRLAQLPEKTIVFYLSMILDNTGKSYYNPEVLAVLVPSANAPIYGAAQTFFGTGIIGGRIVDFDAIGTRMAETGLRILAGEKPQNIARQTIPNTTMFDWRALQRWGIDESRLPANGVVLFRQPTFWEQYKWRIIGVISLIFTQAVLIIGLLLNRAKRRRAEAASKASAEELRQSEARFREMADTSTVLIWIADANMLCTYFNKRIIDFTGRAMEQLLGEGWLEIVHEDDVRRCVDAYAAGYEHREPFVLEYRLRRADGEFRWLYDTGAPRFASNGEFLGYIGSAVDISDRKVAEESLQLAHDEVSKLKNQLEAENIYLQEEIRLTHNVDEIVGESNAIKYVLYKIEQVAQTETTVLVLGETGTGKELVARAIHSQSTRKDRPLVKVNCAALSASLIESELFGHEKGSFTGASARKIGRFELADGATIFLDEIGELPLELQPKLLRVIQEGELERLGSAKTIKVNVRLIAATNRNLKDEVEKGTFREDLWYRLNVFPITVPPLRQRKEDIPLIVEHFAMVFSKKVGKTITSISSATLKKFHDHSWPGNVRELSNVVERALVTAQGPVLHVTDQFERPKDSPDLIKTLEEIEKEHITRILEQTAWRVEGPSGAARILGLNPSTLRTRMGKLGIQKSIRSLAQSSKQQN